LFVSALPGEAKPTKYYIFILFRLFGFSQVVPKDIFGEVGTGTVIGWQIVLEMFAPKIINICQFFLFQSIMLWMLFDTFLFISTHILLILFSPGSAEADIRRVGILNGHLMTSCASNNCTKIY